MPAGNLSDRGSPSLGPWPQVSTQHTHKHTHVDIFFVYKLYEDVLYSLKTSGCYALNGFHNPLKDWDPPSHH